MQNGHTITICMGSSCFSRGNKEVLPIIKKFLAEHQLEQYVFFKGELCSGKCEKGPILKIDDAEFSLVNPDKIYDILANYFEV